MEVSLLTQVTALAAIAVVVVQEILKMKFIPLTFANKYPVPTNIALSIIASIVAVWQSEIERPTAWTGWVLLVGIISVVAAVVYNQLLKNWTELRAMEG